MSSLYEKWVQLISEAGYVQKTGVNDYHKYHYVTEEDLLDVIRPKMAELGLVFFPCRADVVQEFTSGGLITIKYQYKLIDAETGESEIVEVISSGADTGDKGAYKAATGARKYALRQLVLISTGDDPEKDEDSLGGIVKNQQSVMVIRKLQGVEFLPSTDILKSPGYTKITEVLGGTPIHSIPDNKSGTETLRKVYAFAVDYGKTGEANFDIITEK